MRGFADTVLAASPRPTAVQGVDLGADGTPQIHPAAPPPTGAPPPPGGPSGGQAPLPCACLLKMKPPTRTAPPEASDGDPKIVADLSKKVATAYVVSQKSARLSDSMGKKNKKKANLAASFAESMGELSDGE